MTAIIEISSMAASASRRRSGLVEREQLRPDRVSSNAAEDVAEAAEDTQVTQMRRPGSHELDHRFGGHRVMRPVCCLVKSRFRARTGYRRSEGDRHQEGRSNTSSTEPSCMIRLKVADTARSWSAM